MTTGRGRWAAGRGARPLEEILSKREQQVMDVLHRRGSATARQIFDELPDPSSYNAVRGVLSLLEGKGRVRHEREGRRYVYHPVRRAEAAGRAALSRVARTFFSGSTAELLNSLFDDAPPDAAELDRLQAWIDDARRRRDADRAADRRHGDDAADPHAETSS